MEAWAGPCGWGDCLSLEAHPSPPIRLLRPGTPGPLMCPSLPKSLPAALKRKATFLSLIFKAPLCDPLPHQPIQGPGLPYPHIHPCSNHVGPPWLPCTVQWNSLPCPSSKNVLLYLHRPPQTSTTLYPPLRCNPFDQRGSPWRTGPYLAHRCAAYMPPFVK